MNKKECVYPDWEGGMLRDVHIIGQDGFCCICGAEQTETVEHLLSAANYVFLAIDKLEEAGWTVCMPRLQRIFRHILQLIAILDERS